MIMYHSESGTYPVTKDNDAVKLDDANLALIINSHDTNEARSCTILFLGPQAQEYASAWTRKTDEEEEAGNDDLKLGICVVEALKELKAVTTTEDAARKLADATGANTGITTHAMAQLLLTLPDAPLKVVEQQGGPEMWSPQLHPDVDVQVGIRSW
jgi:hypothetical protein